MRHDHLLAELEDESILLIWAYRAELAASGDWEDVLVCQVCGSQSLDFTSPPDNHDVMRGKFVKSYLSYRNIKIIEVHE